MKRRAVRRHHGEMEPLYVADFILETMAQTAWLNSDDEWQIDYVSDLLRRAGWCPVTREEVREAIQIAAERQPDSWRHDD